MLLTQTAEYAFRALAHIAQQPADRPVRAQDLADETGIPLAYLSKILRRLVETELLYSQKGHGGGFRLARPRAEIRFSDILAAMDYEVQPERCAFGWDRCNEAVPCPLHPFWSDLKEQFAQWAQRYTLADVTSQGIPPLSEAGEE